MCMSGQTSAEDPRECAAARWPERTALGLSDVYRTTCDMYMLSCEERGGRPLGGLSYHITRTCVIRWSDGRSKGPAEDTTHARLPTAADGWVGKKRSKREA
jgi:hypothetical protein